MNIFVFSVFLCFTVHGFLTPGYSSFFDPAWIEENNERESANSARKNQNAAKKCLEPATCDECRYLTGRCVRRFKGLCKKKGYQRAQGNCSTRKLLKKHRASNRWQGF
ncbi:Oidioi.mRNA.OKI2018_I69.XSR.g15255.t1.cds [Oikopleura dioica]|uniref:Oidioi.mRNA.OKI2018_I69.XSR.g15255.t1.cds n=1 Tax=Oikopleura dioica TaxID=34765 RepID=A0ABN7SGC4_OIKDI|nr:Oidioi.mRNA.OKI2018_I69.XSR.g15255.t1.cds [Oikopleura dioica]